MTREVPPVRAWVTPRNVIVLLYLGLLVVCNLSFRAEQQFVQLAEAFLRGELHFSETQPLPSDTSLFGGKHYWPQGPFPALLMMPFVVIFRLLGDVSYQGYVNILLACGVLGLLYAIAGRLSYSSEDRLFWAIGFCFSTTFITAVLVPWSWFFAHTVSVFLMFLALLEYLHRKRYPVLGLLVACLLLTRINTSFIVAFFLLELWGGALPAREKIAKAALLLAPSLAAAALLAIYNDLRFGNVFEQGYLFQVIPDLTARTRRYGIFSLRHVPGNLYYFLLSFPLPVFQDDQSLVLKLPYIKTNEIGLSIFATSPVLIRLFFLDHRDKLSKLLIAASIAIAVPVFLYYGIGGYGYRYALDFLPLLYLLLMMNYAKCGKPLTAGMKALLLGSSFFNIYLCLTYFL